MALEAPGEERDDAVRQGLNFTGSTINTTTRGAGGELGTSVDSMGVLTPAKSTQRRRRCAATSAAGAAAVLWCFSAGTVTFLRWRQATPGLRPSIVGGGSRRAGLDGDLQRIVRPAAPPRVLVGFEVVKYEEGAEEEGVNEAKEEKGETNEKEEEEEEEEVKEEEEKKKEVGEGGDPEPAAEEDEDGAEQEQDDKLECAPLYVSGIDNCTEWKDDSAVYGLLGLKRAMLEGVLDVMEDPKSCGEDGDPANPLLLVMKLAVDEADAVVGAATSVYREKATDAGGWSPELGGMNRWLARYYKEVLKGTRPVIVQVHGDDVCALENEISRTARLIAVEGGPGYPDIFTGGRDRRKKREPYDDEDFSVPLALMTVGWDPSGDPTHNWHGSGRDETCAIRLLNSQRVTVWFTSHTQLRSHPHPKFHYLPIGFGGLDTRNGLPQSAYLDSTRRRLRTMEECEYAMLGRYDLLFECNTLFAGKRSAIWQEMTNTEGQPFPVNHCPLPPDEMVEAASTGIFAVSPPGTGPDCFRHYEMMVEGNIALVPDDDSLRSFMEGLPVVFLGKELSWGELTCDRLLKFAGAVKATMARDDDGNGLGLAYEKLTHGYWRNYIRRTVLNVEGSEPGSPYQRRSSKPLDSPGWDTYRHVGCFDRKHGEGDVLRPIKEKSANNCASYCNSRDDDLAGTGFFGTTTDGKCWCGNDIGGVVSEGRCGQPVLCSDPDPPDTCLLHGYDRSDVYVFGPPGKPLDHVYHGCFPQHERFLYHAEYKFSDAMVPELCGAFCTSLRYPFFGVERSNWCRCGVMTRYAGSSVRQPAWAEDAGPHLDFDEPDAATAALPLPGAVIGDPRFQCNHACSGDKTRLGCGGMVAWDMYSVKTPCVLFGECKGSGAGGHNDGGEGRR